MSFSSMKVQDISLKTKISEMHSCMRQTMRMCRWAGVFPVEGLNTPDCGNLRFNVKSLYFLYYLFTITCQAVITLFMVHWFLINDLNLTILANVVFYVSGLFSVVMLLNLARAWPTLVARTASIEARLANIRVDNNRPRKYNATSYTVLIVAVVEHLLSIICKAKDIFLCHDEVTIGSNMTQCYFRYTMAFVFEYVPVNMWTIAICMVVNVQATFFWNFTDVMTMCFSMYLTSYFQDLVKLLNSQNKKKTHTWEQLRLYYSDMVALVTEVDSRICYFILMSEFSNLFFICLQLFNTLNVGYPMDPFCGKKQDYELLSKVINLTYYAYSLVFLLIRAAVMFFLAANVNTVAREPIRALSFVPTREYNLHVQRFNRQLRYTTTALSGLFFYVTREMILKVVAAILTYELVLLQLGRAK